MIDKKYYRISHDSRDIKVYLENSPRNFSGNAKINDDGTFQVEFSPSDSNLIREKIKDHFNDFSKGFDISDESKEEKVSEIMNDTDIKVCDEVYYIPKGFCENNEFYLGIDVGNVTAIKTFQDKNGVDVEYSISPRKGGYDFSKKVFKNLDDAKASFYEYFKDIKADAERLFLEKIEEIEREESNVIK